MPLPVPTSGSLSDHEKQQLSLLASRISFVLGVSFGSVFTVLGLLGMALYLRFLFAHDALNPGYSFEVTGVTLAASVVSFCFGVPVLRSMVKRSQFANAYLTPLFVFCAAAQAKAYKQSATTERLGRAEILISENSDPNPRPPRRDILVPKRPLLLEASKS